MAKFQVGAEKSYRNGRVLKDGDVVDVGENDTETLSVTFKPIDDEAIKLYDERFPGQRERRWPTRGPKERAKLRHGHGSPKKRLVSEGPGEPKVPDDGMEPSKPPKPPKPPKPEKSGGTSRPNDESPV